VGAVSGHEDICQGHWQRASGVKETSIMSHCLWGNNAAAHSMFSAQHTYAR